MNRVVIAGRIVRTDALRYTPAGIPILRFSITHESEQSEAGIGRKIAFELACVAVEREARLLAVAPLGTRIRCNGFLAPKGGKSGDARGEILGEGRAARQLIMHISNVDFEDGEAGPESEAKDILKNI